MGQVPAAMLLESPLCSRVTKAYFGRTGRQRGGEWLVISDCFVAPKAPLVTK